MPSCTCYNWKRTAYPYKHFFLIFEKFPASNWEALSHLHTQSSFLCLDDFQSNKGNSNHVKENCDSSDKHSETSSKVNVITSKANFLWKMTSAYKYLTFLRKFRKVLDHRGLRGKSVEKF